MIQITKVSSKKYEVFESETPIYTIKRASANRYIIRGCPPSQNPTSAGGQGGWNPPDMIIMNSLKEAKDFVRAEKMEEEGLSRRTEFVRETQDVNWLAFFVRHTKGKRFESKEESNKHMSMLSKRWKQRSIETNFVRPLYERSVNSLEYKCCCSL
jgi:hypothetical protein